MRDMNGKTAVVTGGTTGIGFAAAKAFREAGARVLVTGQNRDRLDEAERALDGVIAVQSDATDMTSVAALPGIVADRLGRIDALFLNAGSTRLAPADKTDEATYDAMFDINAKGLFFTAQSLAPLMNEGGAIVLNTSVNNRMGMAGAAAYAASKAAVRSFTRTLAGEWIGRGIRVNAVSPGPVETPIYGKLGLPEEQLQGFAQQIGGQIPMRRFGRPEEIAAAVLFLASNDASFVLGHELVVDGGWTAV